MHKDVDFSQFIFKAGAAFVVLLERIMTCPDFVCRYVRTASA